MPSTAKQPPSSAPAVFEPAWAAAWVPPASVIRLPTLQVRKKLDAVAIKEYAARTAAGSIPPPIKVARVAGCLYLVDGWHRWEAGALVNDMHPFDGDQVAVLVADMTHLQMVWQAATANTGHGVRLKPSECRAVFQAFIKAKMHRTATGGYLGYRDIAPHIGRAHTTIRNWMRSDYPHIFKAMSDSEGGNPEGTPCHVKEPTLDADHVAAAVGHAKAIEQLLRAVNGPAARRQIINTVERALQLGVAIAPVHTPEELQDF